MIPILILAGGASSRMDGRDKLMEEVEGAPLLRTMAARALQTGAPVFVALPPESPARTEALAGLEVAVLTIPAAAEGMSGTLRDAVAALPDCDAFLVLLADLPALTAADLARVIAARADDPDALIWRGTTEDGRPGHPILFDARLRPDFAALQGDTGGAGIVARHAGRTRAVPLPGTRARRDLDTPADWAAWRTETGGT